MISLLKQFKTLKLFLFFLILHCISLERGIKSKLFFSGVNVAVYKMDESPIKFSGNERQVAKSLDEKLLKSILYSFRREKSMFPYLSKDNLWSLEIIEELTLVVKEIINQENPAGNTFFVIVKENDPLSPYSRIFRTTFYLNLEGSSLQFIFGEVYNNINFISQYSFQDWANPSYFPINCQTEKIITFSGKLEKTFRYKKDLECKINNEYPQNSINSKLENLVNYRWVQVDTELAGQVSKENFNNPEKPLTKDHEKRLKELQNLLKKKLITQDDYDLKKAEILSEL